MRFTFATLVDFWRSRLLRINGLLAQRPHLSWGLRLERRIISYCLRRYSDAPYATPPSQAAELDAAGRERSRQLWLRRESLSPPSEQRKNVHIEKSTVSSEKHEIGTFQPSSIIALALSLLILLGLIVLIFILEPM
jgi:hypothetical protein